jgi:hypothetical protein
VVELALLDAAEDLVELRFAHEKSVVLRYDLAVVVAEVEGNAVFELHRHERAERHRRRQAEQLSQEGRRGALVARRDNRVIEGDQ